MPGGRNRLDSHRHCCGHRGRGRADSRNVTEARQLSLWPSLGNLERCAPFRHCRHTPSTMNPHGRWRKRHRNRYHGGHNLQLRLTAASAALPRLRPCRRTETRPLPRCSSRKICRFRHCSHTPATMNPPGLWRNLEALSESLPGLLQLTAPPQLQLALLFRSTASAGELAAAGVEAAAGEEEGLTSWL